MNVLVKVYILQPWQSLLRLGRKWFSEFALQKRKKIATYQCYHWIHLEQPEGRLCSKPKSEIARERPDGEYDYSPTPFPTGKPTNTPGRRRILNSCEVTIQWTYNVRYCSRWPQQSILPSFRLPGLHQSRARLTLGRDSYARIHNLDSWRLRRGKRTGAVIEIKPTSSTAEDIDSGMNLRVQFIAELPSRWLM